MWFGERQRLRLGDNKEEEMAGQVVKVKRETLEACMTCPLCHKIIKEATTISLCLHTFCRKCIYEKLSDEEEEDCCPVCFTDLGCSPVEKLRPDHNLQDIRAKLFPLKRRASDAPEVTPEPTPEVTPSPVKRKERSLSSLVVSTPKVPMQTGLTGKRSRALTRKAVALRGCSFSAEGPVKRDDSTEVHPISSSSTESLDRGARNKMQDLAERSCEQNPKKDMENDVEIIEGRADLWTPLNCLVEAANRTKSSKSNSQGQFHAKSEPLNALDSELYMSENRAEEESANALDSDVFLPKTKIKGAGPSAKGKNNSNETGVAGPVKRRKSRAGKPNRVALSGESSASAQAVLDACEPKCRRRNSPIWFSLVASENWKGDFSLAQISACYLRVKDGKMPVSYIQKYLAKKLELSCEAEVEILCQGEAVLPTLQLQNLVDLWLRTATTGQKVPAAVGSSAKEFVMVLHYCRRVESP